MYDAPLYIEVIGFEKRLKRVKPSELRNPAWHPFPNDSFDNPDYFGLSRNDRVVLQYCYTRYSRNGGGFKLDECAAAHAIGDSCTEDDVIRAIEVLSYKAIIRTYREEIRREEKRGEEIVAAVAADLADPFILPGLEGKAEADPAVEPRLTPSGLVEIWNAHSGPDLDKVSRMTSKRSKAAASRLKENDDPAYWIELVQRIAESPHATGKIPSQKCPKGWKATFEWLTKNDDNHVKVAEKSFPFDGTGAKAASTPKRKSLEEWNAEMESFQRRPIEVDKR